MFNLKTIAIIQNVNINDHRSVYTHGIASELKSRGYDVKVVLNKTKEEHQFKNTNYDLITLKGETYSIKGQLKYIFNCTLWLLKRKKRIDLVHAKNPFSSLIPGFIYKVLKNRKCKIVYDIRGLWIDFAVHSGDLPKFLSKFLKCSENFLMRYTDKILAISQELKKELITRNISSKKIEVIVGDGVDIKKIKKLNKVNLKKELNIKGQLICYLGSISKSRKSQKIILAFNDLLKNYKDLHLIMIGPVTKGQKSFFKDLIKSKKLNANIHMLGFHPHLEALRYVKACDIAVSYHSGDLLIYNVAVPTKILEYLALGKAIVTTNHLMYKNILKNEETAVLTEQNVSSFTQGTSLLLKDKKLKRKLKNNALQESVKYSIDRIVDKITKNIYNYT